MRFTLPKIQLNNKFVQLNIKLREDRAILFICISIALIFWVLVKLSQPYRTEKEIILDFRLPYDKTYTTAPPKDMMATIEGNGWDLMLDFFSNPRITLSYDLRQTDRLDLNLPQLRAAVNTELFSRNIKILELNYGGLYLQLEDEISRLIPVDLVSDISVEKDYELSQPPILKPDSVLISGPVSIIDSLKSWPTDSFVLNNLKNNTEVDLKLVNFPPELSANISTINVALEVEQITEKSLFVPVKLINAPDSITIFPKVIRLSCLVGLSKYDELSSEDFELIADLSEISHTDSKNSVPVVLTKFPSYVDQIIYSPLAINFLVAEKEEPPTVEQ